jgi:hypothetical protein
VTDRYRLPAALGGADYPGAPDGHGFILLDVPGTGPVRFPEGVAVRVVPPEPIDGQLVIVHTAGDGGVGDVFSRHDEHEGAERGEMRWYDHQRGFWVSWEYVIALGVPRRLVFAGLLTGEGGRRAMCSGCKQLRTLRIDGSIPVHYRGSARCPGAERKPLIDFSEEAGR